MPVPLRAVRESATAFYRRREKQDSVNAWGHGQSLKEEGDS